MSNNIEMEISSVRRGKGYNHTAIVLKEKQGERYLTLKVEPADADAIAVKLQKAAVSRPLAHDLLCAVIQTFGGRVRRAVIHDFQRDTFFANLVIEAGRKSHEFDCRPADAIAVTIRVNAPICIESQILDKYGSP